MCHHCNSLQLDIKYGHSKLWCYHYDIYWFLPCVEWQRHTEIKIVIDIIKLTKLYPICLSHSNSSIKCLNRQNPSNTTASNTCALLTCIINAPSFPLAPGKWRDFFQYLGNYRMIIHGYIGRDLPIRPMQLHNSLKHKIHSLQIQNLA